MVNRSIPTSTVFATTNGNNAARAPDNADVLVWATETDADLNDPNFTYLRSQGATPQDGNDGKLGAELYRPGLNFVGCYDPTVNNNRLSTFLGDVNIDSGGLFLGGHTTANLLDDYEEGSWTPEFGAYAGTPATGVTYTTQTGRYTKIGNLVHIMASISWSAISTLGTGYLTIRNIPFITRGDMHSSGITYPYVQGLPTNGMGYIDPSNSQFFIVKSGTSTTLTLNSELGSSGMIFMGGSYQTN